MITYKTDEALFRNPSRDICPRDKPHPSKEQTEQTGEFTVVCLRDGSCLSQGRAWFVPDTVHPYLFRPVLAGTHVH